MIVREWPEGNDRPSLNLKDLGPSSTIGPFRPTTVIVRFLPTLATRKCSRISEEIFQTLEEISEEGEEGNINTGTARKIIRMVRNFNFSKEILVERLRSDLISESEFKDQLSSEGQNCLDSINLILSESSRMMAI